MNLEEKNKTVTPGFIVSDSLKELPEQHEQATNDLERENFGDEKPPKIVFDPSVFDADDSVRWGRPA